MSDIIQQATDIAFGAELRHVARAEIAAGWKVVDEHHARVSAHFAMAQEEFQRDLVAMLRDLPDMVDAWNRGDKAELEKTCTRHRARWLPFAARKAHLDRIAADLAALANQTQRMKEHQP